MYSNITFHWKLWIKEILKRLSGYLAATVVVWSMSSYKTAVMVLSGLMIMELVISASVFLTRKIYKIKKAELLGFVIGILVGGIIVSIIFR